MNERESAKSMLGLACEDLSALEGMASNPAFTERIFGFHAQQAVEKALKALLMFHDVEYPRTHDLRGLAALLTKSAIGVPKAADALLALTTFAVTFRYDWNADFSEPLNRPKVVALVNEVITCVREHITE